jgi:hypothetical protein
MKHGHAYLLKIKRNLGCPPSSHVIVGSENKMLHLVEVEGILTSICVWKRGLWRCYRLLMFFVIFSWYLHVSNVDLLLSRFSNAPKLMNLIMHAWWRQWLPFSLMLWSPSPLSCSRHLLVVFFMDFLFVQNRTLIKI